LVPSGQTLVLGGLREDRNTKDLTKVPLLGDLPGVGRAFRSDTKSKQNRQLLIFVTPTILSQDDYIASPEARDFLKQKPVERPDVPPAPYDSAEPKDWTTPMP
jgi:type II secretory pathway component GspD/PulD (secretin)